MRLSEEEVLTLGNGRALDAMGHIVRVRGLDQSVMRPEHRRNRLTVAPGTGGR